ncbi:lipoyl(octanoyl) transferase LipB [Rickettsiales bacterium LUAb2]
MINSNSITWKIFNDTLDYTTALSLMENEVSRIISNESAEAVWLLEHNDVYTKGSSANNSELLNANNIPVIEVSRGGKFTYHGKGQRIIYPLLNLNNRGRDLKKYINNLEQWIINTLNELDVDAYHKENLIGIWVNVNNKPKKIAAIGVRVQKWITSHGIALNIDPNLNNFNGIIPCGIRDFSVTSLQELGVNVTYKEIDILLKKHFYNIFN